MPPVRINVVKGHEGCPTGRPWAVVGADTGKVHGCHPTKERARAQQSAIYAAVNRNMMKQSLPADEDGNIPAMSAVAEEVPAPQEDEEPAGIPWDGVMGTIGSPTEDGRYLIPGTIQHRDLPVEMHMQPAIAEGHDGAIPVGRIDRIEYVPFARFDRKQDFYSPDQITAIEKSPIDAIVVYGYGELNGEDAGEAKRRIENGADVSIDGLHGTNRLFDSQSFEEMDVEELDLGDILSGIVTGQYLQGLSGDIGGLTIVAIGAFKEAKVGVTASASLRIRPRLDGLVASAGPLKPPADWFENPNLTELTPLQITKEGKVFGHLCDWDGCHIGFQGICVPPFRSASNYAYFNVNHIETAEGELVPCGKIMFSRDGPSHAPVDREITLDEVRRFYDDSTCTGAFVRAGEDRFGTWIAGALRSDLNDLEIQHLRTHGPSGDWRPIKGGMDLVAAAAVSVQGYPIRRALVATAGDLITGIITAPLVATEKLGPRAMRLRKVMLRKRLREALKMGERTRAEILEETLNRLQNGPWNDYDTETLATITAEQRRAWAKSGVARPDGSFPITKCSGDGTSAENARRAIGRANPGDRDSVRAHIRKRENALGCKNGPI